MATTLEENPHEGTLAASVEEIYREKLPGAEPLDGDEALRLISAEKTEQFSDEFNMKLRRKLDRRIPPLCAAVFFTQFLDKASLNYASVMGLPVVGQDYNLVSLAFYVGFLLFEFPMMYLAQKTRVAKFMGINIILWGVVLMVHAVGTSFGVLFTLRLLLGAFESVATPTLILIISMFYKKNEQATRISWFYTATGMSGIIGGFFAYGVSFYDGHVIAPYRIMYILLGALAILIGICVLIWFPDSPVHANFLTKEEKIAALERVRNDAGGTENKYIKRYQIIEALTDPRTWLIVLMMMLISIPNGALTNFSNILIRSFGYTPRQTLILSTPSGAVAIVTTLFCGWYSDKKGDRMTPIIFTVLPTITGMAMLIGLNGTGNKAGLLVGIYLVGSFLSTYSAIYSWNASNISGHTKKSTIHALTFVSLSLGNLIGTQILQPRDAPAYIPGKIAITVIVSVLLLAALLLRYINMRLNREKQTKIAEEKARRGWSDIDVQRERDRHAFLDLTDRENIYFVYTK